MYSRPHESLAGTIAAQEARDLIRSCVHCGFCLPACPTYRVTGNELDSPRGRIYLIKEALEHGAANATARTHLDRCLTCRACETACPSGVQYGRLVDLGRELVEARPPPPRSLRERLLRRALLTVATRRALFTPLVRFGQAARPALPRAVKSLVPERPAARETRTWPSPRHARRMAVLEGCVQPGLAPQINAAAARVLDRLGVSLVAAREVGCCGAMDHHLGRTDAALAQVRRNVDASLRLLDGGVEAIVSTASGCGVYAKDYAYALRHAAQPLRIAATRVGAATRDLSEVIDLQALARLWADHHPGEGSPARARAASGAVQARIRVAWQAPCSLQHGQRDVTSGKVEAILRTTGCELLPLRDSTLCCGSAGTYSILQPGLSTELRRRKLESLTSGGPDVIATANIGCLEHLRQASPVPVRHWVEIVDAALRDQRSATTT
ncbi:MAG TPA: glycolate oxidase subunit GlcF [Steroidobacteraceae bacterium]|nr:glycolate oxidase subunit GlcF [Steroidobacteraceae bacterium]